jgi:GTP-binding protein Era
MATKSGFVSIIGKPNSGKSTLLNSILDRNLSAVTPKPQTTRNKIFGIYTEGNVQIVFVDTPGIIEPKYKLQAFMKKELESSLIEADVIVLIVDVTIYNPDDIDNVIKKYEKEFGKHKIFCVLNKIDLMRKEEVLQAINEVSNKFKFDEIIPISAQTGFNVIELVNVIEKYLPEAEFYFDEGVVTSQPEKFFVAEIIRSIALKIYKQEIPFSVYVDIEDFKERGKGKDYIRAAVILEKESQKKIVIGKNGLVLKKLGETARREIEELLDREVYLDLFVKVKKNWRNDEEFLKRKFKVLTAYK